MKEFKGITIIALVITIVVLLILAGVGINMAVNSNGIFGKATESRNKMNEETEKESIRLAIQLARIGENGIQELTKENIEKEINHGLEQKQVNVVDQGNQTFVISFENSQREYEVTSNGEIQLIEVSYTIKNVEELKAFRDEVNNGRSFEGEYVYLLADIQLDQNEQWDPIGKYPNDSPSPDHESNRPFKGTFDGQGHEINGIKINTTEKVKGFFGLVENGTIRNLGIGQNNSINGGIATAGLVGYIYNNSRVVNCYNKADINGTATNIAGIVGVSYENNIVVGCYNKGKITTLGNNGARTCRIK